MYLKAKAKQLKCQIVGVFLLMLTSIYAPAQVKKTNNNNLITKDYVDHLIKTLSADDMQGRATFSPGIDKAASFIENEFKKIGLQPLPGEKTFRQQFFMQQIIPQNATVTLDGAEITPHNFFATGILSEKVSLDKGNAEVVKMDTLKSFRNQFYKLSSSGKNQIVLVDEKFANDFKAYQEHFSAPSVVKDGEINPPNMAVQVFIIGKSNATNFSATFNSKIIKSPLFNVAGIIPGKSKAKEMVVFSGHYDHLGFLKAVEGDSIANGADDDASGTTAVIALAKYYKAQKNNERTLIFVAFTAEEIGGYGSQYFSKKLNPDDVTAMFNIEMIGKEAKFGKNTAFITGYERSDFGKILQKNLSGSEFTFYPDPYPQQNLFYRSDNATLAALGVPAHTISTDKIDIDKLYHSVKDEYNSLDVENILSTIKAIAKSAQSIVSGVDTPTRIPKLENRN